MKEVINHLERIVTLTSTHGISHDGINPVESEDDLKYKTSKIRFNAVKALELLEVSKSPDPYVTRKMIERFKAADKEPRNKEVYEKVSLSILLMNPEFIASGVYQKLSDGSYSEITLLADFVTYIDELFLKVTKPIEWWEDAVAYLEQNRQSGSCDELGTLSVGADMSRDQWCDFARILLEQGE